MTAGGRNKGGDENRTQNHDTICKCKKWHHAMGVASAFPAAS